jgi:hypothetical protein
VHRELTAAVGLGLIGIGIAATLAPGPSAAMFGIPTNDADAFAFVRAAGARDAIAGAILLSVLENPAARRRTLGFVALIGLADAIGLATARGLRLAHATHVGGFVAAALIALTDRP